MKTIKKLLFLTAIVAAFVSCEIPVNGVEFETDLNVQAQQDIAGTSTMKVVASTGNFSKSGEVDLNQFSDVKDRLDKLKSMSITQTLISATDFKNSEGIAIQSTIQNFTLSFPDLGITKNDFQGTTTKFTNILVMFSAAELTKIQNALLKDKKIKYMVSGKIESPVYPVSFTVTTGYTANFKVKLF